METVKRFTARKAAALCATALSLALCLALGCTEDGITGALIKSRPQHTVTFSLNGGYLSEEYSLEATTYYSGTAIKSLPPVAWEGHTFEGWFDGTGANATQYTKDTKVTKDVTLVARWTAHKYTVTFDVNGGLPSAISPLTVDHGSTLGSSLPEPWNAEYYFVGWFDGAAQYTAETRINGPVALTAKWGFLVTFDANGGPSSANRTIGAESGRALGSNFPPDPARTGYTFDGWFDEAGTRYTGATVITGEVLLTAAWTELSLIDARDGKRYAAVKIGSQTWMAENLNYTTSDSWCYDCVKYGRLYTWDAARSACPAGWHLPSREEWTTLVSFVGSSSAGTKLKAKSGWNSNGNGTDDYGFSALPGGARSSSSNFGDAGFNGYWWSATESGGGEAYYRYMLYNINYVGEDDYGKRDGFSVRCVGAAQ